MFRLNKLILVAGVMSVFGRGSTFGANIPQPRPIAESIANAEVIVAVTLDKYTPDVAQAANAADRNSPEGVIESFELYGPGVYDVSRIWAIKGDAPAKLQVHLPMVSAYSYGRVSFELAAGARVLLLLRKAQDQWLPVDPRLPLIPVSPKAEIPPKASAPGKSADALDVILASMPDKNFRPIMADIIQKVKDPRMAEALRPYTEDDDRTVRSDVLHCLATNQDVSAIPKIAQMAAELEKIHRGSGPVDALLYYKSPESVKYLNPLLVDEVDFTRADAIHALRPIADKTSIPFLMKALEMDDRQRNVSYDAYWTLHRLDPSLGPPNTRAYFLQRRDAEVQTLKQWWEWEQVKAKKAAATQTAQTQPATQPNPANP